MLWYKSWLETRWRFIIGLVVLMCSAAGTVLAYPKVIKLMPLVPTIERNSPCSMSTFTSFRAVSRFPVRGE